ncbi:unnamed protein product [Taenia asiatica]|uniref:N-end rule aminoacyl transferase C-terminal domain-containing protein n=1 Tax=Taenia asiatica TaxID=60517 RepID=A0A3P6Q5B9_TAEAS|nr:unnamed protein product [Taenia asiatica]
MDEQKLIVVGVVDLDPNCLSSLYFFYNPRYPFLNLGTFVAILFVVANHITLHSESSRAVK